MIEFKGYLTGAAEKGYKKKVRKNFLFSCCFIIPLGLPVMFLIGNIFEQKWATPAFCTLLFSLPLIGLIPPGKKDYLSMLPKKIVIKDDHMVCITDRDSVSRFIKDVSKVIDHGEFYELCFPFGKFSERFICQKNLLTKGSIKMFEDLFDGKIIRK